jgi:hypothetical protein
VIWPQDGCASIALPQWRRRDFLPLGSRSCARIECAGDIGSPIPREARKSRRRHPPLRSGPAGASSIACRLSIAIETAMVAGSRQPGRHDMATTKQVLTTAVRELIAANENELGAGAVIDAVRQAFVEEAHRLDADGQYMRSHRYLLAALALIWSRGRKPDGG